MFGRAPRRRDTPPAATHMTGYHTETIVVADPDRPVLARERALRMQIGQGLQGYSGTAVGYDQGDPGRSFNGLATPSNQGSPTDAMARVGRPADAIRMATVPEYSDVPASDSSTDPYMSLAFNRIAR